VCVYGFFMGVGGGHGGGFFCGGGGGELGDLRKFLVLVKVLVTSWVSWVMGIHCSMLEDVLIIF
jgi:hypothetical protein